MNTRSAVLSVLFDRAAASLAMLQTTWRSNAGYICAGFRCGNNPVSFEAEVNKDADRLERAVGALCSDALSTSTKHFNSLGISRRFAMVLLLPDDRWRLVNGFV